MEPKRKRKQPAGTTSFRLSVEKKLLLAAILSERMLSLVNFVNEAIRLYDVFGPKNIPDLLDFVEENQFTRDKIRVGLEDLRREYAAKRLTQAIPKK